MKNLKLSFAVAIALSSGSVMADSWGITQQTTPSSATTMTQNGSTSDGSIQAMNVINGATSTGAFISATQTGTLGANALILDQAGTTTASTQAVNYLKTNDVGVSSKGSSQLYNGSAAITLNQNAAALKNNNLQAVNVLEATTITNAAQNIGASATTIQMNQSTSGANIQAINNSRATTDIKRLIQGASVATDFDLNQAGTGAQIQALNRAVGGSNALGIVSQVVEAPSTNATQLGTGVSTQALNTTTGAGANNVKQSAIGTLTMVQGGAAAVGNGSIQAGNHFKSTGAGVVTTIDQDLGSGANAISMTQNRSDTGTVQAGNMIDMKSSTGSITGGDQDITTTGNFTLAQNNTGSALQAGNAIVTDSTGANIGGTAIQKVAVGTLSMTQTDATDSIQAANYLGVAPL